MVFLFQDLISTCPNCGTEVYGDLSLHDRNCEGGNSGVVFQNNNSLYNNENATRNEQSRANSHDSTSLNTNENRKDLQTMFPDSTKEEIADILDRSYDLEEAVSSLLNANSSTVKLGFSDICDIVSGFQSKYTQLQMSRNPSYVKVNRSNLWRDGLHFYKSSMGDLTRLQLEFRVSFENEDGVDCGALRAEFFTKFFEVALKELFEQVNGQEWQHVPKRSGGNVQIFKVLGAAIAHSILHKHGGQNRS